MGWTKRQLVTDAFGELALAGHVYDLTPEELAGAMRRMDAMVATWDARGIRIGYALPSGPDSSDLDADSGIPDWAADPLISNLAVKLAAGFGKALTAETKTAASEGMSLLLRAAAYPGQQQYPSTMPRGAGNRAWRMTGRPFFSVPDTDPTQPGDGGDLSLSTE